MKEGEIVHIDQLVEVCGFFFQSEAWAGYGCKHPKQEEKDRDTSEGACMPHGCPLAWRLYPSTDNGSAIEQLGLLVDDPDGGFTDARLLREQGWDPEDDDGSYLCLMVDLEGS